MSRRSDFVTDHAVVRYLERVYGVDVKSLKRRIELVTREGRDQGANAVNSGGVHYVLSKNGKVTTLYGCNDTVSRRGQRWRARHK